MGDSDRSAPWGGGSRPPRVRRATQVGGSSTPPSKCCPMVAAVQSVKRGKFRLARRYAAMSVRLMAAQVVRTAT